MNCPSGTISVLARSIVGNADAKGRATRQLPLMRIAMESRTRVVGIFVAVSALIMIAALASIFVGGLRPQLVAPVGAGVLVVSVVVFTSRFNAKKNEQSASTQAGSQPPISQEDESSPGIKLLRIVIIGILCAFALNAVIFGVEAWKGTLNTYALRRFIPKAAFAAALIGYILRKIKTKTPF